MTATTRGTRGPNSFASSFPMCATYKVKLNNKNNKFHEFHALKFNKLIERETDIQYVVSSSYHTSRNDISQRKY
jgi:hypothetical protein